MSFNPPPASFWPFSLLQGGLYFKSSTFSAQCQLRCFFRLLVSHLETENQGTPCQCHPWPSPQKNTHTQKKTTGTLRNGHTNSHQGSFDQENDLTPAWVGWQRRLIHMIRFPTQSEHLVFSSIISCGPIFVWQIWSYWSWLGCNDGIDEHSSCMVLVSRTFLVPTPSFSLSATKVWFPKWPSLKLSSKFAPTKSILLTNMSFVLGPLGPTFRGFRC